MISIELFLFSCHSREGGNPVIETTQIPAFRFASAGMTVKKQIYCIEIDDAKLASREGFIKGLPPGK